MDKKTIDLRHLPPVERHEKVVEEFERLDEGEVLEVINDHEPKPLAHQMDEEVDGFDMEGYEVEKEDENRFIATLPKTEGGERGNQVQNALEKVTDPSLNVSVIESGVVTGVRGDGSRVMVEINTMGISESEVEGVKRDIEETVERETDFQDVRVVHEGSHGVTEEEVKERLGDIRHPDRATVDLVESDLVDAVEVEGGTVTVSVRKEELSDEVRERRDELSERVATAVHNAGGVDEVRVKVGDDEEVFGTDPSAREEVAMAEFPSGIEGPPVGGESPLSQAEQHGENPAMKMDLSGIENVLLVASTKGGVGKTTVATQLAHSLRAEEDVGLLDADFSGPDVPEVLGLDTSMSETNVVEPVTHEGIQVMSLGLIENRPKAWNGEMIHNTIFNLIEEVDWDVDTLVVDVPPGISDTLMTFLQFVPIDGAVLVTTPHPTSVSETNEEASLFREGGVPVLGGVVNMAKFECPTCGDEHAMFAETEFEDEYELEFPVLAELPFSRSIQSFGGEPPEEIDRLVGSVKESMASQDSSEMPEDAFDVRDYPQYSRIKEVSEEFAALEPGEELSVISDQNPAGLAVGITETLDMQGSPSDAFDEYTVTPFSSDEWLLKVRKPS